MDIALYLALDDVAAFGDLRSVSPGGRKLRIRPLLLDVLVLQLPHLLPHVHRTPCTLRAMSCGGEHAYVYIYIYIYIYIWRRV